MVQIPILSGIYTTSAPDVRVAYPVNMVPVPLSSGVSSGYLRPADGLVSLVTTSGIVRGLFAWDGLLYGVAGTDLVTFAADGTITVLGTVAAGGPVRWAQGFDRLGVRAGTRLYYWNGSALTEVTDPDLGEVIDVIWIDGYWMTTDGTSLVVTELTDPTAVNPLKYGSAEASPDPVIALQRLRNEVYALNRFTIEVFDNVGGNGFPFQRIEGAQIQKGCIGTNACCVFNGEAIAFVGSGQNEAPGVYLAANGNVTKISDHEIDHVLADFSETQLAETVVEYVNTDGQPRLYIHLPNQTLLFDAEASSSFTRPVWSVLTSSMAGLAQYRARFFTWSFDRWNIADPTTPLMGYTNPAIGTQYGDTVRWEFSTPLLYNEGRGVSVKQLELIALTGAAAVGTSPTLAMSWSNDGQSWSQDRFINAGTLGQRGKRLVWLRPGAFRQRRIFRFRGDTSSHLAFQRLEAELEALAW